MVRTQTREIEVIPTHLKTYDSIQFFPSHIGALFGLLTCKIYLAKGRILISTSAFKFLDVALTLNVRILLP